MLTSAYFGIAFNEGTDVERITSAYLYNHSKVRETKTGEQFGKNYTYVLVETFGDNTQASARYYAQYQADRLASGMYAVTPVQDTKTDVWAEFRDRFDLPLEGDYTELLLAEFAQS